jgi:DNA-binding NtrC family response regulator
VLFRSQDGEVRRVGAGAPVRVDVRIVSASNEDLELLDGRFRRDLFYRLNVLRVDLPPLRERPADLPALAGHFLTAIARETGSPLKGISTAALERLARHPWLGNVRELENALRRACAVSASGTLSVADFAFLDRAARLSASAGPVAMEDYMRRTVEQFGSRMTKAELAERLGVSRKTLWKRKKRWGIQ